MLTKTYIDSTRSWTGSSGTFQTVGGILGSANQFSLKETSFLNKLESLFLSSQKIILFLNKLKLFFFYLSAAMMIQMMTFASMIFEKIFGVTEIRVKAVVNSILCLAMTISQNPVNPELPVWAARGAKSELQTSSTCIQPRSGLHVDTSLPLQFQL